MKALLPLLLAFVFLAPVSALAGGALGDARGANDNPARFDGGALRPEGDLVPAGPRTDRRSPEQIAKDEQAKAAARGRGNLTVKTPNEDKEIAPPKPNSWTTGPLIRTAIIGALAGLVIGSLFGPLGLILGPIIGAALLYGMDKYAASKKKDDDA